MSFNNHFSFTDFNKLSDSQLLNSLTFHSNIEYQALLNMILGIVEIEKRGSIIYMGYNSTFSFLTQKLKYSEGAANRRIYAARCIAKFPFVFSLLKTRQLNLSTVCLIRKILNTDNLTEVL